MFRWRRKDLMKALLASSITVLLIQFARRHIRYLYSQLRIEKESVSYKSFNRFMKNLHDSETYTVLQRNYNSNQPPPKTILVYSSLFGVRPWPAISRRYKFFDLDGSRCRESRCRVTYDMSDLKSANAVLGYGVDLLRMPIEKIHQDRLVGDSSKQIWIYFNHEPPTLYPGDVFGTVFNWTASYRPDSDIYVPYFDIEKLPTPNWIASYNMASGKDKEVLAIISNCWETRLEFIRQLIAHKVIVDVYGGCSHYFGVHRECKRGLQSCRKLRERYKFYLAFENSFCEGYVTEKYYDNGILSGLVPIVAGAANYSDPRVAIQGSFIDARNFENMTELAKHINYVSRNATAYNAMFNWRNFYRVKSSHYMCKFCKALWATPHAAQKTVNLSTFWSVQSSCGKYNESDWKSALKASLMQRY